MANPLLAGTQGGITVNAAPPPRLFVVAGFPSPILAGTPGTFTVTARDASGNVATGYRGIVHFGSNDPLAVLPADYTFTAADNGQHTFTATLNTACTTAGISIFDRTEPEINGTQSGITVLLPAPVAVDHAANFNSHADLAANGSAGFTPLSTSAAQLVNGGTSQAGSIFTRTRLPIGNFTTTFTFQLLPGSNPAADGFTFTIQNDPRGPAALGEAGGSLGYGKEDRTTNAPALVRSVAVKFDLWKNFPEGQDGNHSSTGLYVNGHRPDNPPNSQPGDVPVDLAGSGIDFNAGIQANPPHTYSVMLTYDGTSLNETLRDLTANRTFTTSYTVDIPTIVGGTTAYVGFTGADGGATSVQNILTWSGQFVPQAQPAQLTLSGPATATAGAPVQVTVTAVDIFGRPFAGYTGTVHFTSSDGRAVLPADYTFTAADQGTPTFTLTLKTAGSDTVTVADPCGPSFLTNTATVTVQAAAAARFVVAGYPSPVTAGTANGFTVTALDAYGNTATGYTGTVRLTSSDGQAGLPANYTFTASDRGVHNFSATLKTAGTQALTATDTGTASITGSQSGIQVTAASATQLVVAGFPSPVMAGTPGSLRVTVRDPYGNVATGYTGTVTFTSSDAQAVLPGSYTFTAADAGVHDFSATLKSAGAQFLTATDAGQPSLTGTQAGIAVNPGLTSVLAASGFPSPITAGAFGGFLVTALDAYGNVTPGYRGTVHLTSSDGRAGLQADHTFTAADNGRFAFGATLVTAGTQSLTATDVDNPALAGTQAGIMVVPGPASAFAVAGFPSPVAAGTPGTVTVTVLDAYGNVVIDYTGTVHLGSTDPQAALDPDYTFTPADQGMAVFNAVLYTPGSQALTATDVATGITGSQDGIVVTPGPVSQFQVVAPDTTVAGVPFTVTVYAEDQYGNVVPDYAGTVHFTSTDPQAVLPDDYTFTADDAGVHTFSVTLATAGDQDLTLTDQDANTGTATVTVTPAAADHFRVDAPGLAAVGVPFTVTVAALDPYGNVDPNYTGTVSWTSSDPTGSFDPNPYTFTAADAGVASFTVTLNFPGYQTIVVTDADGNTGSATIILSDTDGPGDAGRAWSRGLAPAGVVPATTVSGTLERGNVPRVSAAGTGVNRETVQDQGVADVGAPPVSAAALDRMLGDPEFALPYGAPLDDLFAVDF